MNPAKLIVRRWSVAAAAALAVGCVGPLDRAAEQAMLDHLAASHRALAEIQGAGRPIELTRPPSEVDADLGEERLAELDELSGPRAYEGRVPVLGQDLLGQTDTPTVALTLQQVIALTVRGNIDLQEARLAPAVNQTLVTQAQAAFDAVFFSSFEMQRLDQPRPTPVSGLGLRNYQQTENDSLTTGIKKQLTTGGQIRAQTSFTRVFNDPPGFSRIPEYHTGNIELGLTQPLLRNFGEDVNRAAVVLAVSAQRQSVHELRGGLLNILAGVEQAYWRVAFTRQRLLIQERLLERTIDDYKRIKQREGFDVSPVRMTEAGSFVELRRAEVIRARQEVRNASDALKRLINAPELPLSGETLVVAQDQPVDAPMRFDLLDAVTTALRNRPELRKALLQIEDASVRMRVADNARLPLLNLAATLRYTGLAEGSSIGRAYDRMTDGDFIDYILGVQFEAPIGNRAAEAGYQQRVLERQAATLGYQRQAQDVVVEVKRAMRELLSAYEIIGAARAGRRAAADNLRAIERQEEIGVALTPEFLLDLKLNSQQRLADAETQEIAALADYNSAVANFYRAIGTLDQRNGIRFEEIAK